MKNTARQVRLSPTPTLSPRKGRGSRAIEPLEPRALLASNGLFGQYYDDANLTQLRMTRQDIAVDFDFGQASPVQPQMSADTFSARWTGQVQPEFGEEYT